MGHHRTRRPQAAAAAARLAHLLRLPMDHAPHDAGASPRAPRIGPPPLPLPAPRSPRVAAWRGVLPKNRAQRNLRHDFGAWHCRSLICPT
eukprot:6959888-Prymnesium_polylepis.1